MQTVLLRKPGTSLEREALFRAGLKPPLSWGKGSRLDVSQLTLDLLLSGWETGLESDLLLCPGLATNTLWDLRLATLRPQFPFS